jgi:hypothetical protein
MEINKMALEEFLARYDRDRIACDIRYKEDRDEARRWREAFSEKLEKIDSFLSEIRPAYRFSFYVISSIVLGAFGVIFTFIWNRVAK